MKKFFAALAAVAVLATTAACSNQTVAAAKPEKVSASLQPFYIQKLTWSDCGAKLLCTFVAVPLNWQAPSTKDQLKLAVVMHQAKSANGNFLFTNPGGPGASGYDFVHDSLVQVATQRLIDDYNIV
ncbi:MAG: alpha/beta hydrolase, partial [Actinomycetes bacterium]